MKIVYKAVTLNDDLDDWDKYGWDGDEGGLGCWIILAIVIVIGILAWWSKT